MTIAEPILDQPTLCGIPVLTSTSVDSSPMFPSLSSQTFGAQHGNQSIHNEPTFLSHVVLTALFTCDAPFNKLIQELLKLTLTDAEHPEDLPATQHAVAMALYLMPLSRLALGSKWTAPHVASDSYGGLRLSWIRGDKELRAVIPGNNKAETRKRYLYWDVGEKFGSIQNFTPSSLAAGLVWLKDDVR